VATGNGAKEADVMLRLVEIDGRSALAFPDLRLNKSMIASPINRSSRVHGEYPGEHARTDTHRRHLLVETVLIATQQKWCATYTDSFTKTVSPHS
jgi:hypothetical protein